MSIIWNILLAFIEGIRGLPKSQPARDKALREKLSEREVDRMVQDSFPASDPPSTY